MQLIPSSESLYSEPKLLQVVLEMHCHYPEVYLFSMR